MARKTAWSVGVRCHHRGICFPGPRRCQTWTYAYNELHNYYAKGLYKGGDHQPEGQNGRLDFYETTTASSSSYLIMAVYSQRERAKLHRIDMGDEI